MPVSDFTFTIDREEDTIEVSFQLPDSQPLYIEVTDKNTSQIICFFTYSCTNNDIIEDVDNIKDQQIIIEDTEILDILEILGYI